MPQSVTATKTEVGVHSSIKCKEYLTPLNSQITENNKNVMQCMKRRLQYSQLPVRCQKRPFYRPTKSPFKLPGPIIPTIKLPRVNSGSGSSSNSTCSSGSRIPFTPRCKKSVSMIDLSPVLNDPNFGNPRSNSSNPTRREGMEERKIDALGDGLSGVIGNETRMFTDKLNEEGLNLKLDQESRAAALLCRVLIVNAWRRRREEVFDLQETIQQLTREVDHLHIQITVLRRLLDTEKSRVGKLTTEINMTNVQLNEVSQERDALKVEKNKLEDEIQILKNVSEEKRVTAENLKNQLINAQNQLEALDGQISRDREKLLKLREDKKILLEKVMANETLATERGSRANRAEAENENLQLKLVAQIALAATAQKKTEELSKQLELREREKEKLEEQLKMSKDIENTLVLRSTNLESELSDREDALRRIETAYTSQMFELNELKERLIRQSQESGWSNRFLHFAGSVVRVPRAILRTLSFFTYSGSQVV